MAADDRQQGDVVLLPGQECPLADETSGNVITHVGPRVSTFREAR